MQTKTQIPFKIGDTKKKGDLDYGMDMNTLEHVENIVLSLKPGEIHKSYKTILDELNRKLENKDDPKSVLTDQ